MEILRTSPEGFSEVRSPWGWAARTALYLVTAWKGRSPDFDARITIPLRGRASRLIPPQSNGGPALTSCPYSILPLLTGVRGRGVPRTPGAGGAGRGRAARARGR